ncbi:predicted protein [Plenodomus lingam JN3]|uniref:Predicted protein n=1 Tax=Leptosphaeria maculans (strain JN3 / isolate v23.1.3 / race Av1-4-5-6-7-8) TaxID=985895 RepID=E5ABV1_LEPMJ|nr:predicted protein [Plenodomus lingam JN3]CBY01142.1 predicted protein [Plenodomus lingam JN3]
MAPLRSRAGAQRRYDNRSRIDPIPPPMPVSLVNSNIGTVSACSRFPERPTRWRERDITVGRFVYTGLWSLTVHKDAAYQLDAEQAVAKQPAVKSPMNVRPPVQQAAVACLSVEQQIDERPALRSSGPEQFTEQSNEQQKEDQSSEQQEEEQPTKEQSTQVQPVTEQVAEAAAQVQSFKKRSTQKRSIEKQSSQADQSKKHRADERPAEKQAAVQPEATSISSLPWNHRETERQQLHESSEHPPPPQPSVIRSSLGQQSSPHPSFIQSTMSSFYEGRIPLQNPENAERERRRKRMLVKSPGLSQRETNQNSETIQQPTGDECKHPYAVKRSFSSLNIDSTQSPIPRKREGVGFSYSDSPWQSFNSDVDTEAKPEEDQGPYRVAALSRPASKPAVDEVQSPFLVSGLKPSSTLPPRTSINEAIDPQLSLSFSSFSSTASTIADDYNDMVVMREVGSFYVSKPQRALPCTVATREDTIRLKAQAKLLFDKYAESSDIQAALMRRLERMVLVAQEQSDHSNEEVQTLLSHALKIRDFLLRTQEERVETGELRRLVVHEAEWVKWLVEACRTGVMHMRTSDCNCRPEWVDAK